MKTTTAYHWVITLRTQSGQHMTSSGVLDVPAGATRAWALEGAYEEARRRNGVTVPAAVLFWSLEPNVLSDQVHPSATTQGRG